MLHNLGNNKRIAKNTIFLYIRMLLVMGVSLYTSRVVLDKLGVVDYGLFNTVAGVVGILTFLSSTLSTSTSRFLTYALGAGDEQKLKHTFCTAFYSHLILAFIVVFLLETVGLWFVYNKLVIPPERFYASLWAFHISVFIVFVAITQVPYTSVIIAHENMNVYAYLGIFEAIAKLLIVYLLAVSTSDKLILYAILIGLVQFLTAMFYRSYCVRHYGESNLARCFDKSIFHQMLSFSGQSLIANVAHILSTQGIIVLINLFFSSVLVAAQAIGNQISGALMQFVSNLQTAINPQIIKLYASGDREAFRKLTLNSSVYVHELLLLLALPAIVVMEPLLHLWLVEVPPYAVVFAQFILLRQILNVYNSTLYVPMIASGELKYNSLASVWVGIGSFVLLYLLLKMGFGVMWVQYIGVAGAIVFSYAIKPYILCRKIGFSWHEILASFVQCVKVSVAPVAVSFACHRFMDIHQFGFMLLACVCICITVCVAAYANLEKTTRLKLNAFIVSKIGNRG